MKQTRETVDRILGEADATYLIYDGEDEGINVYVEEEDQKISAAEITEGKYRMIDGNYDGRIEESRLKNLLEEMETLEER